MRKVPNWLTAIRLALIPLFVVLMVNPSRETLWIATAVFLVAAVTDYADGYIARRYRAVTELGKLLDPLADKILVMAALVMLTAQRTFESGDPWVPGWMVVVILAREIWVTGLRGIAAAHGHVVAASPAGKVKSVLQMVAIVLLLAYDLPLFLFGWVVECRFVGLNVLFLSILWSVYGAVQYTLAVAGLTGLSAAEPEKPAD
jgi:CDP-diacylglycerol--glycerol-3-phosphate 3-phosphatidyltransferase